jgi:hypothetical protein
MAGVVQGQFATVPVLLFGVRMRLFELFEAKEKKLTVKSPPPRNFVAKHAKTSGAGTHKTMQKKQKRDEKKLKDD